MTAKSPARCRARLTVENEPLTRYGVGATIRTSEMHPLLTPRRNAL